PLSFAQERLWFLEQLQSLGSAYHEGLAYRLDGSLNIRALEQSFGELIRRHENLRTRFEVVDGRAFQTIDPVREYRLEVTDLSGLAADAREEEAQRLTQAEMRRPFDLARGPLFRASLLRLSAEQHVAVVTMHHIISDGWSLRSVLPQELGALYLAFSKG
ncbi:condensation domain-containing protein, partial [Rhizobium leguminosarum]|uniref:condensation domain-containing protein n=1 Tax=Rhizobium leguminosarum TaxID=384 RepID=UPI003F9B3985